MKKKKTLYDYKKGKRPTEKVFCPRCSKSNEFKAFDDSKGFLAFECIRCGFYTFTRLKAKE